MAFIPRLPTWNLSVTPYQYQPATRTRVAIANVLMQMYPPLRTSDNEGSSDGYLVYPKENDVFKDPREYNDGGSDAVVFTWNGKLWAFVIEQVLPRFAGFPNGHLMALVRRMSADEFTDILGPLPPSGVEPLPAFATTVGVYRVVDGIAGSTLIATVDGTFLGSWQLDDRDIASTFDFAIADYDSITPISLLPSTPQETDVLQIEVPSGSGKFRYYWVQDTVEQNYGTSVEFTRAVVLGLSADEVTLWFPNTPDAGMSTISASPTGVLDDGFATTTVSGTMLDSSGNPVAMQTVSILSSGSATGGTATTDASGNWSITSADTVHESVTYTATCLGVAVGPSNAVEFAPPLDCSATTLFLSSSSAPPDGTTPILVTITALLTDATPAVGVSVSATVTGSAAITTTPLVTDGSGQVVFQVTDATLESGIILSATVDVCTPVDSAPFDFEYDPSAVSAWSITVAGVGNNSCLMCSDFDISDTLNSTTANLWSGTTANYGCSSNCTWGLGYDPGSGAMALNFDSAIDGTIASYTGTVTSWDGLPITLSLNFDNGKCTWPATMVVTPM